MRDPSRGFLIYFHIVYISLLIIVVIHTGQDEKRERKKDGGTRGDMRRCAVDRVYIHS